MHPIKGTIMPRSVCRFAVVGILGLLVSSGLAAGGDEQSRVTGTAVKELKGNPPPAPAGYKKADEIKTALLLGTLKPVDVRTPFPTTWNSPRGLNTAKRGTSRCSSTCIAPKICRRRSPALIFIHGGGWKQGKRGDYRFYCQRFAKRGYVVTSVSYRLVKDAPFPAAVAGRQVCRPLAASERSQVQRRSR